MLAKFDPIEEARTNMKLFLRVKARTLIACWLALGSAPLGNSATRPQALLFGPRPPSVWLIPPRRIHDLRSVSLKATRPQALLLGPRPPSVWLIPRRRIHDLRPVSLKAAAMAPSRQGDALERRAHQLFYTNRRQRRVSPKLVEHGTRLALAKADVAQPREDFGLYVERLGINGLPIGRAVSVIEAKAFGGMPLDHERARVDPAMMPAAQRDEIGGRIRATLRPRA